MFYCISNMRFYLIFDYFISKAKLTHKNNGIFRVSSYILSYALDVITI